MKLCGIIAEFNPFTNGHSYIINKAKEQTGLDVLCLMSGNLVQRGELSIIDKYQRAITAIKEGASFVIELPTRFALSSAQNFAEGAIKTLIDIGNISHLAFGIKLKNTSEFKKIAYIKANEPKIVKDKFKQYTKLGLSYSVALFKIYNELFPEYREILDEIQKEPNNILALEYLTAMYKLKANIEPVFIQRTDNGYNSLIPKIIKVNNKSLYYASASKIRSLMSQNRSFIKYIPKSSHTDFINPSKLTNSSINTKLECLLINTIRNKTYQELEQYQDYNNNLSHLIKDTCHSNGTLDEIINVTDSKCYRPKRIKKLLIYPYLELTKEKYLNSEENNYLTVLAVDKTKKSNLSRMAKVSKLKLIISHKDLIDLKNKNILTMEQKNTNLYNLVHGLPVSTDITKFI